MGTWGALLYDDDEASDLRNTLKLMCKIPVPGDRLLELLIETHGDCDPNDPDDALFWLVTADQFERRGIECHKAASTALSIIDGGSDLASARERGADEKFLKKRRAVLEELASRLKSPRKFRPRVPPRNPPPLVLSVGEVYAFRTMGLATWHPYWIPHVYGPFEPDGWGAMVVLATGRAFNWLPWVALASLTVEGQRKPTLEEALQARLIYVSDTMGAGRFIPKPSHARGMKLELLGRVELDERSVEPHLSTWRVARAIAYDWTIAYGALSPQNEDLIIGCELSSLLKKTI
jgi:hypothetical protein